MSTKAIEDTMTERDIHEFDVATQDMGIADWYFCDGIERDTETWLVEVNDHGKDHKPQVIRLPVAARHEVLLSTHGYLAQFEGMTATLTRRSDGEVTRWVAGRKKRRLRSLGRSFTCAYLRVTP